MRAITIAFGSIAVFLAMDTLRLFGGEQWLAHWITLETHFYFALSGALLPCVYLLHPRYPLIDIPLALSLIHI